MLTFYECGHITSPLVDTDICAVSRSPYTSGAPFNYFDLTDLSTYLNANLQFMKIVGTWNAATNTPALTSGVGTPNEAYIVSTQGSWNIDGNTQWPVGTVIMFDGIANVWRKIGIQDTNFDTIFYNGQFGIKTSVDFFYQEANKAFGGGGSNNSLVGGPLYSGYVAGNNNSISFKSSFIGGGEFCSCTGEVSFAVGRYARALHNSTYVAQLDSATAVNFDSTLANTYNVRAANGIGLQTNAPNSDVTLHGTQSLGRTAIAAATADTSGGQALIAFTADFTTRTLTLLTADVVVGRYFIIKDESGTAGTNFITIATQGTETIDGQASIQIAINYGFVTVYSDGTNWFTR